MNEKLLVILLLIPVLAWGQSSFSTIEPPRWIKAKVESQPDRYWDDADGSTHFVVALAIAERNESRYGDPKPTPTIITGVVIVPPDTMWAYCSGGLEYFHKPFVAEGDTINFSTRDEGVSMQDSYWDINQENYVVPLKAIRPRGR